MTISYLVNEQSYKNPDKIAVKHGTSVLTYQQLNKKAAQLARYLYAQGLQANDVVALAVERCPEMIIFFLAFAKAGITYLPIDPNFPSERINYMLNDAGVLLLITSKGSQQTYHGKQHVISIESALKQAEKYSDRELEATFNPENIAYILYTSGSTGLPKGVLVKRSGILNLLLSTQKSPGMDANDTILFTTTVAFDIAELEIFLPLISGATMVIADADTVKDGRALIAMARKERVTIMQGTPFMYRMMLESGWKDKLPVKAFCGGEAMTKELADELAPRCNELWNMYGPTETSVYSTIKKITGTEKIITVGQPIANTQIYLLDESLKLVPAGEVGEICIGGAGVAKGYLNKPELTSKKFIDNPFSDFPNDKIYRTGDLGRMLEDGDIQCLGRIDHQIKIRGYRIETEEIESQLKLHEKVTDALTISYKDEADNVHLVAYVVPKYPFHVDETAYYVQEWKEHLAKVLPEYMIPDIFMPISAIPISANGKTDRNALPRPIIYQEGRERYVAPKTDTEKVLARIFLNNIAIERIGLIDNFFKLGIDSLIMVKVMIQIEKEFGKRYPLSILIKYPNLNQLAWLIDNNVTDSQYKSLVPIKPRGNKVPLYIVHGIGLNLLNMYHMVSMLDAEQPVYGLQAMSLEEQEEPTKTIEDIAALYNKEILMHDDVGPYAISGYSFGGYIAFEMVKQLRAMGKEVKILAMFDTNLQTPTHHLPMADKIRIKGIRQFKKIWFRLQTLIKWPLRALHYMLLQIPVYYYQLMKLLGVKAQYNPADLPPYMLDIMQKLHAAFRNYALKPQDVKIDLFKAAVKMYYVDDPMYFGWKRLALNGVNVHVVPGDHREMFMAPNDKFLAQSLQRELDKIN